MRAMRKENPAVAGFFVGADPVWLVSIE